MNPSVQRDLLDYDVEDQNEHTRERPSDILPAWCSYAWLPLEDVPQGALLYYVNSPDVSEETKAAIRQELRWRLEDLQAWAEREHGEVACA
jgi:hypothetical protein